MIYLLPVIHEQGGWIQQIMELNSVSAICITETWLSPNVPDSCVAIPGYNLFCKDRITTGGGVCINLDQKVNS